jgi:hypothetical protein
MAFQTDFACSAQLHPRVPIRCSTRGAWTAQASCSFLARHLPLVRPALAAVPVLVFTFVWMALLVAGAGQSVRSARSLGLSRCAACGDLVEPGGRGLLAAVPPVTVFFFMQRHLIRGLAIRPRHRSLAALVPVVSYTRMGVRPAGACGANGDSARTGGGSMKSILDPSFHYVPSSATDVRKTFARIRRELKKRGPADERVARAEAPRVLFFTRSKEFASAR